MDIKITYIDTTMIVAVNGEIDHHTAATIKEKIEDEYTSKNAVDLLFDFANVNFMDSSGIGMIMGRYKNLVPGGAVKIFNVSEHISKIFALSGLTKIISFHQTLEDALVEEKDGLR